MRINILLLQYQICPGANCALVPNEFLKLLILSQFLSLWFEISESKIIYICDSIFKISIGLIKNWHSCVYCRRLRSFLKPLILAQFLSFCFKIFVSKIIYISNYIFKISISLIKNWDSCVYCRRLGNTSALTFFTQINIKNHQLLWILKKWNSSCY